VLLLGYALIFGAVQVICTYVGTRKLFQHLDRVEERHRKDRLELIDRIQHPEIVRVQEVNTEVMPDDDTTREILHLVKGD